MNNPTDEEVDGLVKTSVRTLIDTVYITGLSALSFTVLCASGTTQITTRIDSTLAERLGASPASLTPFNSVLTLTDIVAGTYAGVTGHHRVSLFMYAGCFAPEIYDAFATGEIDAAVRHATAKTIAFCSAYLIASVGTGVGRLYNMFFGKPADSPIDQIAGEPTDED